MTAKATFPIAQELFNQLCKKVIVFNHLRVTYWYYFIERTSIKIGISSQNATIFIQGDILLKLPTGIAATLVYTEMEISSFGWNFRHCLHRML